MLKAIIGKHWPFLVLTFGLLLLSWLMYTQGTQHEALRWQAKWNEHVAQDAVERQQWTKKQRELEHAYASHREAFELDMQTRMGVLGADVAAGVEHADRLQKQLDSTRSALQRASKAAELAGVNTGAAEAALVLSDLYSTAVKELQRVAGTADQWYEQADGCNRFYKQIKEAR